MILHKSQFVNSREDIFGVEDPTPLTPTHVTVPHSFLIEEADKNFESFNLPIKEEKFYLSRNHQRFAGVYVLDKKLRSDSNLKEEHNPDMMLSFFNSNDKSLSAGVCFGTVMPMCKNVGWWKSFWIKRKHIGSIMEDLSSQINVFFSLLDNNVQGYNKLIQNYKETEISDVVAKGIAVEGAKKKVIPSSKILPVVKEWENPSFEYDDDRKTLYRLHNAFTTVMRCYNNNPITSPQRSFQLINVLSDYHEEI